MNTQGIFMVSLAFQPVGPALDAESVEADGEFVLSTGVGFFGLSFFGRGFLALQTGLAQFVGRDYFLAQTFESHSDTSNRGCC